MFDPSTRFLVVDDMGTMLIVLRNKLKELGYQDVTTAENGHEAFKLLEKRQLEDPSHQFQAVICDWMMPVMNGLELLVKIREDERFKSIPFMLVTAEGEAKSIHKSSVLECDGYLQKPINTEKLGRLLSETVQRIKMRQRAAG